MNSVRIALGKLNVDFSFGPGITAIYGHRGAGKSLLLEAIAGIVQPDSGRILLDDAILYDHAARVHLPPQRRRCALVPKGESLFPHMKPRQNLMFAAKRWPRLERHRRVAEMIEKFHLTDQAPKLRWTIARALLSAPKLLLLDEPELDAAFLREVGEKGNTPVLMASRNLDFCCSADQLLVLDNGRILQRGAPRDVVDRPDSLEVARLVGIPNLFLATVGTLDPGRNRSVLDFENFSLNGPYFPGHFRGDRVWVAVAAENLLVHPADRAAQANCIPLELVRTVPQARSVMLEFSSGVFVRLSHQAFERQKDNEDWLVEFPPDALRVL